MSSRVLSFVLLCFSVSATEAFAASACEASRIPDTMQAVRLHAYGGPEQLRVETVSTPSPTAGEVLIRTRAASINPIDWKQREGRVKSWWPLEFPAVLGRDVSGVIVAVGDGVSGFACGDEVVALLDTSPQGGYAEFVPAKVADVAKKPAALAFDEAAAYPLVAMTAWRALVDQADIGRGDRVLIHGGAGGVGSMAVQIAKARGAYVYATASAANHAFLRELGVDMPIDYRATKFETVARDLDFVLDTVGGDTLARSVDALKAGGTLVSIVAMPPKEACASGRIACPPEAPHDNQGGFAELGKLIASKQLRVHVDRTFPLAEAARAQELNREGHTRGKIVLTVGADASTTPAAHGAATR